MGFCILAAIAADARWARAASPKTSKRATAKRPVGRFALRRIWHRPDRIMRPQSALPIVEIAPKSGWCDDVTSALYNLPISRPTPGAARNFMAPRPAL